MQDEEKTKKQLVDELAEMRRRACPEPAERVAELEASGAERADKGNRQRSLHPFDTPAATQDKPLAKEDLRVEKAYFEQLFEGAPEAIVLVDNDGQVLRVNSEFTRMFGYTLDEICGRSIDEVLAPGDLREGAISITKRVAKGEKVTFETVRQRKDGALINVSILGAPIKVDGEQVAVYGIYRDITERKRVEQLLRALNQASLAMEQALTLEGMFAAGAEKFDALGFSCVIFLTDEDGDRLFPKFLHYDPAVVKAAERLTGLKAENFSFLVEAVDVCRKVVGDKKTIFVENMEEVVRQVLPGFAERFTGQVMSILKISNGCKGRRLSPLSASIAAPLVVEDKVFPEFKTSQIL